MQDNLGRVPDFSKELASWLEPLVKKQEPDQFKLVRGALDPAGRNLVDHHGQMGGHTGLENSIRHYQEQVLNAQATVRPVRSTHLGGITRKLIYQGSGRENEPSHFMVKPYHERIVQRCKPWMQHPHQGWAEMANQGLYHAGGIGHLHQKVHVEEHNMGPGAESEPALVVHIHPGYKEVHEYDEFGDNEYQDARKIALMDFLTNNLDRHAGNLLAHPDRGLLAIDHPRSFQYKTNKKFGHPRFGEKGPLSDSFTPYTFSGAMEAMKGSGPFLAHPTDTRNVPRWHTSELWEPTFDWWGTASQKVRARMAQELKHIKDPVVAAHIQRNFNARADILDEMSDFGVGNYGRTSWAQDVNVPMYRPHEKADGER